MRIRLEFDASVELGNGAARRRLLVAVPPGLNLVGDLSHHLHRSFLLPPRSCVLSVDGFTLLPAQRIADILRDDDVLCVRSSSEDHPVKRRRVAQGPDLAFPALADAPPEERTAVSPEVRRIYTSAPGQAHVPAAPKPLALPQAPAPGPANAEPADDSPIAAVTAGKGVSGLGNANGTAPHPTALSSAGIHSQPAALTPREAKAASTPTDSSAHSTPPAGADAKASGATQGAAIPDPAQPDLWKAIVRHPAPGEFIRYRTMHAGGLSSFRAAQCVSVVDADGFVQCRLRSAEGVEAEVDFDSLLQLSVVKPAPVPRQKKAKPESASSASGVRQDSAGKDAPKAGAVAAPGGPDAGSAGGESRERAQQNRPAEGSSSASKNKFKSFATAALPCLPSAEDDDAERRGKAQQRPAEGSNGGKEAGNGECQDELTPKQAERLARAVQRQFDYYFGDANYAADNFLRGQADEDGWTSLKLVSSFNRMRALTKDLDLVRTCLKASEIVEVSDCGAYVRRRGGI